MENKRGKGESSDRFPFLGLQNHYGWWLQPWNQKTIASCRKVMTNLDTMLKSRDITLLTKVHIVKAMVLPVVTYDLWELDHKEGRTPKNWHLQIVVLEKIPESPLDSKEIKPVNLKGGQPWIVSGRTNADAEAPVFWSSDANRRLIGKVPDDGKDWRQKETKVSEDEMDVESKQKTQLRMASSM